MKLRFYWTFLRFLCKHVLKKHAPKIVLVTGSVGKSSSKAACAKILSSKFKVRESAKNFNSESGLSFSILGVKPAHPLIMILSSFFRAVKYLISSNFPSVLVLEAGIDKKGDMDFLVEFFIDGVDAAVITCIEPVHLENFNSFDEIIAEKRKILKALKPDGLAVLNYDNKNARESASLVSGACKTYGRDDGADLKLSSLKTSLSGTSFEYNMNHFRGFVTMKAVASFADSVAGAGILIGMHMGIENEIIEKSLEDFKFPGGRFEILNNKVIDSAYNASPTSMKGCIETFAGIEYEGEKIMILGDMLELGEIEERSHSEIISLAKANCDKLILVGKAFSKAAKRDGFDETFVFDCANMLLEKLNTLVSKDSLILVKGSLGMKLSKVVKKLNDIK